MVPLYMPRDGVWLPYYDYDSANATASSSLWGPGGVGLVWPIEKGTDGLVDYLCSLLQAPGSDSSSGQSKSGCPDGAKPPFTVQPGSAVDAMRKRIPKVRKRVLRTLHLLTAR
jgi:hypothetical protein